MNIKAQLDDSTILRSEDRIKEFLASAVFYPASRLDPRPVMELAGNFSNFVYVDYSLGAKRVEEGLCEPRFAGYRVAEIEDVEPEGFLGCSWKDLPPHIRRVPERMKKPFIKIARLKKRRKADGDSGAEEICILYICGEALTIYEALYRRRDLAPGCLAYINPGIYEGGNYLDFPGILAHRLLIDVEWWLPKYLLHDFSGMDERAEDFFAIHPLYEPEDDPEGQSDDVSPSPLALHRLKNPLDPMEVTIAQCDAVSRVHLRACFERRENERKAKKKRGLRTPKPQS
ncbi:MAG: hypothetical protein D4R65_13995 [Verrucomicrobiaceae bacterium]|nr:MAG: hypothetical protein D4R65_13995 [Verrucomicrobiaceae bacterium]